MYQVMVVDDEPMAASLIVNIIKRKYSDFEIMGTAYDGEEALELMEEKGEPDVLITDIQMPVMNGYEATANIRAGESDYWKTIPVIAMTANVFQEDESRAAECGMSDYVTKPIDMNVIYSVLEKWLLGQKG